MSHVIRTHITLHLFLTVKKIVPLNVSRCNTFHVLVSIISVAVPSCYCLAKNTHLVFCELLGSFSTFVAFFSCFRCHLRVFIAFFLFASVSLFKNICLC